MEQFNTDYSIVDGKDKKIYFYADILTEKMILNSKILRSLNTIKYICFPEKL